MTYTLYVDQFILFQTGMNYMLLLLLEELFFSRSYIKRRLFASLAVSVVNLCIMLCPGISYYVKLVLILCMQSVVLVMISFPWMKGKKKTEMIVTSGVVSILSGSILSLIYRTNKLHRTYIGIVILTVLFYMLLKYIRLFLLNEKRDVILQITIEAEGTAVSVLGIQDSGNLLKAGKGHLPVAVVERSCLQHIDTLKMTGKIPYVTLGNPDGYLEGVICDRMLINEQGSTYEYKNVILGLYHGNIANGKYQVILPSLQELKKYQSKTGFYEILKKNHLWRKRSCR